MNLFDEDPLRKLRAEEQAIEFYAIWFKAGGASDIELRKKDGNFGPILPAEYSLQTLVSLFTSDRQVFGLEPT